MMMTASLNHTLDHCETFDLRQEMMPADLVAIVRGAICALEADGHVLLPRRVDWTIDGDRIELEFTFERREDHALIPLTIVRVGEDTSIEFA